MVNRNELPFLSIGELAPLIRDKSVSPVELAQALLDRIDELNPKTHAFLTVDPDAVLAAARAAEQEIMAGHYRGPLHGIPLAHKDVFYTQGLKTTAHSRVLENFIPDRDATAVARLKGAGAITLGKTNTHEFACGGMEFWGFARNPWDLNRVPGGSSSGTGVAVAAHMAPGGTGTDTGGSIRIPSNFCGIVGLKPTYGRVSRVGMTPLSWHMDHPGPMARRVLDTALMLNAMAGPDVHDPTTHGVDVPDFTSGLGKDIRGLRAGIPRKFFFENLHPEVEAAVEAAIRTLEGLGVELVEVEIPHVELGVAAQYVLIFAEAATLYEKYLDEQPQNFGRATYHRLLQGRFFTAVEYLRAMKVRQLLIQEMEAVMKTVDVIVSPTTPYPAYTIAGFVKAQGDVGRMTRLADATGHPSITLPCGFTSNGLPIGLMITGRLWDEVTTLQVAHAYEQATTWHQRRAPVTEGPEVPDEAGPEPASGLSDAELREWMERFAAATGQHLSEEDLNGVLQQIKPLREALAKIRAQIDLTEVEFPFFYPPRGV